MRSGEKTLLVIVLACLYWSCVWLPRASPSLHKLDIVIHPQFKTQFGNYAEPVESQINLAPEVRTTLWKGMSLAAQLIIPLQNELSEEGDYWRPGLLTINQFLRLPSDTFVSATLGYFTRHRYGMDVAIKKYFFADRRWSVGANVGYTGYASYRKEARGTWYYSDVGLLTSFFNVEYLFPRFDLSLSAMYGKFLYEDRGWRFDILRQFGDVDIGFFVFKTETGHNGGFNFCIPIPQVHLSMGPVRIGPAEEVPWEYCYKGLPRTGIQYEIGSSIDECMERVKLEDRQ